MTTDPVVVAADADVLVADLLVGEETREALDHVRRHSWIELAATEQLLADAAGVITVLADESLATAWRERIERECRLVDQPADDHPGLAAAYQSDAEHLLTFDESLTAARTNHALQPHAQLSIRSPDSFARLFDPAPLYEDRFEEPYPGPDCDPRS
jgi:predicted nucleic acid-binding protein